MGGDEIEGGVVSRERGKVSVESSACASSAEVEIAAAKSVAPVTELFARSELEPACESESLYLYTKH